MYQYVYLASPEAPSRRSPVSAEGLSPRYSTEVIHIQSFIPITDVHSLPKPFNSHLQALRHPSDTFRASSGRVTEWGTSEGTHSYPPGMTHFEVRIVINNS